jgi:hypothetical protein
VVEEKVVCDVVMHAMADGVDDAMVDVPVKTADFTVGITDANGTPLQGAVGASEGRTGKPSFGKKSRLRKYRKGKEVIESDTSIPTHPTLPHTCTNVG